MKYQYRLKSTGNNSAKYGACEICDKEAFDVFFQSSGEEYKPNSWAEGQMLFGHRDCLLKQRREGEILSQALDKHGREITIINAIAD